MNGICSCSVGGDGDGGKSRSFHSIRMRMCGVEFCFHCWRQRRRRRRHRHHYCYFCCCYLYGKMKYANEMCIWQHTPSPHAMPIAPLLFHRQPKWRRQALLPTHIAHFCDVFRISVIYVMDARMTRYVYIIYNWRMKRCECSNVWMRIYICADMDTIADLILLDEKLWLHVLPLLGFPVCLFDSYDSFTYMANVNVWLIRFAFAAVVR